MPLTPEAFEQRTSRLKADLVEQGRRVQRVVEASVESVFEGDVAKAAWVIEGDEIIDKADVDIERAAVQLLHDATRQGSDLTGDQLRMVLTVVKINNELERAADCAVTIAERVHVNAQICSLLPVTFRVMANSVVGILQSAGECFERLDAETARVVLASDDTVDAFEEQILRETQERLARGDVGVDFALAMHSIATELERIGDHCTNIAEQVIYVVTGNIVRHSEGHWTAPEPPR